RRVASEPVIRGTLRICRLIARKTEESSMMFSVIRRWSASSQPADQRFHTLLLRDGTLAGLELRPAPRAELGLFRRQACKDAVHIHEDGATQAHRIPHARGTLRCRWLELGKCCRRSHADEKHERSKHSIAHLGHNSLS